MGIVQEYTKKRVNYEPRKLAKKPYFKRTSQSIADSTPLRELEKEDYGLSNGFKRAPWNDSVQVDSGGLATLLSTSNKSKMN